MTNINLHSTDWPGCEILVMNWLAWPMAFAAGLIGAWI